MAAVEAEKCAICLLPERFPNAVLKPCKHSFCYDCITQWLTSRATCPLCQAPATAILRGDGRPEEAVTPPEAPADSGPADLGCLDHSYFRQETTRLLSRARTLQLRLLQGSGRRSGGSAGGAGASAALEAVVASLGIHDAELRREVPFQPEALLQDLYRLEGVVTACAAGSWVGDAEFGGAGGLTAHRLGAEDAGDGEGWCDGDSEDGENGLDAEAERAGRRLSQGGRRRSGGNLAGSRSSGSLSGSGRRR